MTQPLSVLGGLTAEQFLTDYWQKKPLLVRNALPDIIGMFEPQDIKELALEPDVTARLITQNGNDHAQWKVKRSPLALKDFKQLPPHWTLLVQAVDHYSLELQALWRQFDFIPQWRREDIMVSYAPKGGSVGQHFDFYDVFLLQGYGHRRWQLGQQCDSNTPLQPNQPLQLLTEMQVDFDEILAPGDLLYVPPHLAHYGVAQDDCLTFSFGFRMPNSADLLDRISEHLVTQSNFQLPVADTARRQPQNSGLISDAELALLKNHLLQQITQDASFNHLFNTAVMAVTSESKYPDNIPEPDALTREDLRYYCQAATPIQTDPASRLLYRRTADGLEFWANGELLPVSASALPLFQQLADGEIATLDEDILAQPQLLDDLLNALNQGVLLLHEEIE